VWVVDRSRGWVFRASFCGGFFLCGISTQNVGAWDPWKAVQCEKIGAVFFASILSVLAGLALCRLSSSAFTWYVGVQE